MRSGGGVAYWGVGRTDGRFPCPNVGREEDCPSKGRQRRNGGGATPVHFSISLSPGGSVVLPPSSVSLVLALDTP